MRELEQLASSFTNPPIALIGVSLDAENADALAAEKSLTPNRVSLKGDAFAGDFSVGRLPLVLVIDQKGILRDERAYDRAALTARVIKWLSP